MIKDQLVYDDPIDLGSVQKKLGLTHILVNGSDFVEINKTKIILDQKEKMMLYKMMPHQDWFMVLGRVCKDPNTAIILAKQKDQTHV